MLWRYVVILLGLRLFYVWLYAEAQQSP